MLTLVLCSALLFSLAGIISRMLEYRAAASEYAAIANVMAEPDDLAPSPVPSLLYSPAPDTTSSTPLPVMTPAVYISGQVKRLMAQNSDTTGYLQIPGTTIQYPVVRGKDNSYYTNHTFLKKKNSSGAIFMDCKNTADLSGFNIVLYGHNMKDGSMFHELLQYRKTVFVREHRKIELTGLNEKKTFYVFSAYTCNKTTDIRGFRHVTSEERQAYLSVLLNRSEISAGAKIPTATDQIITLVTCRENREKDYFVVHGVLVD
jgi:sortase B